MLIQKQPRGKKARFLYNLKNSLGGKIIYELTYFVTKRVLQILEEKCFLYIIVCLFLAVSSFFGFLIEKYNYYNKIIIFCSFSFTFNYNMLHNI